MTQKPESKDNDATKICLCMLTKNSSKYIVKTLDSIIKNPSIGSRIGYCVLVVDSATTDNCEEVIKTYFSECKVPLKMKRVKWQNYSYNRNLALDLCDTDDNPCEYTWMNDDDDYLVGNPIIPHKLDRDTYQLRLGLGMNNTYWRPQIIKRSKKQIRYTRRVHEYLENAHFSMEKIEGAYYMNAVVSPGGKEKQLRYIALLEEDLKEMPGDSRSIFYMAESYFSMENWTMALEKYQERAELDQFQDEVYICHMNSAVCHMMLKHDWGYSLSEYLKAFQAAPHRPEAIARIANNYSLQTKWNLAYEFAQWGLRLNPNHGGFLQNIAEYDYVLQDVLALSAINLKKFHEAIEPIVTCLSRPSIPESERPRLLRYMDIVTKETRAAATSELGGEDIQRWLTPGEGQTFKVNMPPSTSLFRSLLRCSYFSDTDIYSRFNLPVQAEIKGISEFENIVRLSLGMETKNKESYVLIIPNDKFYCARLWFPSQHIGVMQKLGASVLVLSMDFPSTMGSIAQGKAELCYDMELNLCYYKSPSCDVSKYCRIEKQNREKGDIHYLACPVFMTT